MKELKEFFEKFTGLLTDLEGEKTELDMSKKFIDIIMRPLYDTHLEDVDRIQIAKDLHTHFFILYTRVYENQKNIENIFTKLWDMRTEMKDIIENKNIIK